MIANIERTKEYARAFWQKELIDRPYVCVTAPKAKQNGQPPEKLIYPTPANTFKACINEDYDGILSTFEWAVSNTYYAGEAIPSFEVTLGPDLYAGFLGSRITAGDMTTWAHPVVEEWKNFNAKIDKTPDGYFNKVKRFIEYTVKNHGGNFMVNMLDLHGNMDALSALRGPQNLCLDLYDCPEDVMKALIGVRATFGDVYDMAYKAGDMEKRGTIGWSPIYCENKSAVLQCDFSCMISPELVRKYVVPAITEEAEYLDHCVYHCDGKDALGHIDDILAIEKIDCIQWVPGDGQPRTVEWLELLKKIQKAGKSVWIYDWSPEEIKKYYKQLEPNKTAFSVNAESEEQADDLINYLVKNT